MNIAVTSGKGGVGKTFVATNLAAVLVKRGELDFIDCDVEAPNAHLFLTPANRREDAVELPCPTGVDSSRCDGCGRCAEACYYNALAVMKRQMLVFPELCRWCGACLQSCPNDAIQVGKRNIGTLLSGESNGMTLHWALLETGAGGMSPRLIRRIKQRATRKRIVLDSPPGTTCPVVETIHDADIVVLVGDATPFGLHDLKLSAAMCRSMNSTPFVVVNRAGIGEKDAMQAWLARENLTMLAEFPDSRAVAQRYSRGELIVNSMADFRERFEELAEKLQAIQLPEKSADESPAEISIATAEETSTPEPTAPQGDSQAGVEIVVVSGKGGVGKTSLAACFAQLAGSAIADCDVDAADLHLLLQPAVETSGEFQGGRVMRIDPQRCIGCGACEKVCQFEAIRCDEEQSPRIIPMSCEGCGACIVACPAGAIQTQPTRDGEWFLSGTRLGPMSHARLEPARENSGKLVTLVRKHANTLSARDRREAILLDGSPGTGCPVIASVGGAKAAVVVTEPTVSGMHDLERILELTAYFRTPAGIVINKADLNDQLVREIHAISQRRNAPLLGELPYDDTFNDAQQAGMTILEFASQSELAEAIRRVWTTAQETLLSPEA